MKTKYLFSFIALIILFFSVSCVFAVDNVTTLDQSASVSQESDIALEKINQVNVDNSVSIKGNVTDNNGQAIKNTDVNISLTRLGYGDNEYLPVASEIIKTDENGVYNYSYKSDIGGQLNITVFNKDINKGVNTSVFIAPKSTNVSMTDLEDIDLGDAVNITGKLTDCDGNVLRYTGVGVLISGKGYGEKNITQYVKEYVKTDKDGNYNYLYKPVVGGSLDVCVYYGGYHYYRFNQSTSHLWVMPKSTKVSLNEIQKTGDEIFTISGRLTDVNDKPLRNTSVGLLFNGGEKVYVKTDLSGNFTYDYIPKYTGITRVTAYYPGYQVYRFNKTETVLDVDAKELIVTIEPIKDVFVGDNIIVYGKVTDENGVSISNLNVEVVLPKEYTRDKKDVTRKSRTYNGLFSANFEYYRTHPVDGNITLLINIIGNKKPVNINTYTFEYPKPVTKIGRVILDPIKNITFGENLTISGKVIDENNMPIKHRKMTIFIDDARKFVTTDENGLFALSTNYLDLSGHDIGQHHVYVLFDHQNNFFEDKVVQSSEFSIKDLTDYSNFPMYTFDILRSYNRNAFLSFEIVWAARYRYDYQSTVVAAFIFDDSGNTDGINGFGTSRKYHPIGFSDAGCDFSKQSATYTLYARKIYYSTVTTVKYLVRIGTPNSLRYYYYNSSKFTESNQYVQDNDYKWLRIAKVTVDNGEFKSIEHLLPVDEEYVTYY